MKRTLTASVIFAATLGIAGLAQAQTPPASAGGNYETPGKPSAGYQAAPSVSTSPAVPTNSNPYWRSNYPAVGQQQQAPVPTSH
jgi:hypothetical protein